MLESVTYMPTRTKARRASITSKRRAAAPVRKPGRVVGRASSSKRRLVAKTKLIPVVAKPVREPVTGFTKALKYLNTLADFERLRIVRYNNDNFNLDRMRLLLKKLGNPHEEFKSVHVAGTKGKGSTCAMIASMLQACGYKVGLYTSPHLTDIRERIQVNGEMISHSDFARIIRNVEPIATRMKPTPTYFDVLTAAAFKYFAEQKVDIAVVETGLGGRLASTNGPGPGGSGR